MTIVLIATAAGTWGCDRDNIADESAEMPPPRVAIANDQRVAEVVGPDDEAADRAPTNADASNRY